MICQRCMRRIASRNAASNAIGPVRRRAFSQSHSKRYTPVTAQTTTASNPRPHDRPAATSTSAAQPFSTPLSPSPDRQDLPIQPTQTKQVAQLPASSVPAGTVLKGLNFMKNKLDPIALEDHEYPAWLWTVLEKRAGDESEDKASNSESDLFSKSKKERRRAAKALRKQQLLHPESMAPKVPLYAQSIDLPSGDGTVEGAIDAGRAREELTQAMRDQRRKKIKEANFLRAMR